MTPSTTSPSSVHSSSSVIWCAGGWWPCNSSSLPVILCDVSLVFPRLHPDHDGFLHATTHNINRRILQCTAATTTSPWSATPELAPLTDWLTEWVTCWKLQSDNSHVACHPKHQYCPVFHRFSVSVKPLSWSWNCVPNSNTQTTHSVIPSCPVHGSVGKALFARTALLQWMWWLAYQGSERAEGAAAQK